MKNDFCKICGECFDEKFPEATHHCTGKTSEVRPKLFCTRCGETNVDPSHLCPIPEGFKRTASGLWKKHIVNIDGVPRENWHKVAETSDNPYLPKTWIKQKIDEANNPGVMGKLLGKFVSVGYSDTCPTCLINPAVERSFTAHEIRMKIYEAKWRSIIDEKQMVALLLFITGEDENESADED